MPRGIRQTGSGWQVFVRRRVRGEVRFLSKHFPPNTPLSTLKHKRDELAATLTLGLDPPEYEDSGTLAHDCAVYLRAVASMPTFSDRAYRIRLWRDALGPSRVRRGIKPHEIRAVLAQWQQAGASAGTLNLRLTALRHLWRVLDGRDAYNPVREIPRFREEPAPLVLPSWATALKVVTAARGMSGLRLRVLLFTGWPSSVLKRVTADHINYRRREVTLHPRRKGAGTRTRVVPVLPEALAALKALQEADGFGEFSNSSLYKLLKATCVRLKVKPFHPYALRHLFLTTLARKSGDERGLAELALHTDPRQTRRYTEHAASTRARSTLATFATK